MEYQIGAEGLVCLQASPDEILTLRHCIIEALEALGDVEFSIRTGGPKAGAEELLETLKRITSDFARLDDL